MSARVDGEAPLAPASLTELGAAPALAPLAFDNDERYGGPALPNDHPAWLRDAVSLSHRARQLIARLKPVVRHVVSVWEHRVRSIVVAGRKVSIDPSGSYRLD